MEIVSGKIVAADAGGLTIRVPYADWQRYTHREYEEVQVGLVDGRTISPEQRRKAYAIIREIAQWSGLTEEQVKLTQKRDFMERHLQGLRKSLFSLSDCDMTTAREFIGYLIDFMLEFGVPCRVPLSELCEDISRYVYGCLAHKVCAVCGRKADLHHVNRVGMGRDRNDMCHIGMQALPLCREHHQEAHRIGDEQAMRGWHLMPVAIDERIAKQYKLGKEEQK